MNGFAGGTTQQDVTRRITEAGYYDASGNLLTTDRGAYGGDFSGISRHGPNHSNTGPGAGGTAAIPEGVRWIDRGGTFTGTGSVTTPGSPGLLALLQEWAPQLSAIDAANLTAQRTADINDVANLGAASREAIDAADPETAKLIAMMTESANSDLALGSRLNPEQERQITNSTTARAGANGWGFSPGDIARTAIATTDYGQKLEDNRRTYATGITALRQGIYGDPFQRILGRPAGTSPQSWYSSAMQTMGAAGPQMFGTNIDANDLFSSNQNATASNNASQANNNAAMAGAGITAAATLAAAL